MTSALNVEPSRELAFALDICARAGAVAMRGFETGISSVMKEDDTPVTAADKECERLIREAIAGQFPGDEIIGEEEGETPPRLKESMAARRWIIDPIDGTYNYARQVPIFATLLSLEEDGEIVLGVVHAPATGETYWGEKGKGAFKNGKPLRVSTVAELKRAQLNFGAPKRILEHGHWQGFTRLVEKTYRQRGFGDYLGFALVFEGKAEAMLEVGVKSWDLAPMKIIVEEAGGRYSDLSGGRSIDTGSCLASNGRLHDEILAALMGR